METYKIRLVKEKRPSKWKYQILKVEVDKKYRYFIIHTKIYRHEIIETISFNDCDYIEIYSENARWGMFVKDNPLKVVERE